MATLMVRCAVVLIIVAQGKVVVLLTEITATISCLAVAHPVDQVSDSFT